MNEEAKSEENVPPSVALMGLNLRKMLSGVKNMAGIVFETSVFSMISNLADFFDIKPKKVLVMYRKSEFEATIAAATEHLSRIGVTLDAQLIDEEDSGDEAIASQIRRKLAVLKDGADKPDAQWVMLDPKLLSPSFFTDVWLPAARGAHIPFVTGLNDLASKELDFATMVVTPDLKLLGHQASQMIQEILVAKSPPDKIGVEEIIGSETLVNTKRVNALGLKINNKFIDRVKTVD